MTSKLTEAAKGVYIIAATPFTDDGALDLQSVDTLTDFYMRCGVHGFTLLGMMGEAHKLTAEESIDVVKRVIGRAGDRQVIVGVSHAGLENVRRLAHEVMVAGASGVMVAPPAGLKGDDGIYNYYAQVFAALGPDIPVVYQDYPQATGVYPAAAGVRAPGRRLQAARDAEARGCAGPRQADARARGREEAGPPARLDPGRQWRPLLAAGAAPRRRRRR